MEYALNPDSDWCTHNVCAIFMTCGNLALDNLNRVTLIGLVHL